MRDGQSYGSKGRQKTCAEMEIAMRMYDIIMKKRNGGELTKQEIEFFVDGYTTNTAQGESGTRPRLR